MEARTLKETLSRYRYVLVILLAGIFLMVLPEGKQEAAPEPPPEIQPGLQQSLTELLSRVEGAGKVEVLLTEAAGAKTLYQSDTDSSRRDTAEDIRRKTVLIQGSTREEEGLVVQVLPPEYQGAVVLCQGADRPQVRLAIVQAVMSATGLRSDNITVLKMK